MRYALERNLSFDFVVDLSGTHYPVKSNHFIRTTLASNLNAVYMDITPEPSRPEAHMFNQFVECDGALHRVARMPIVRGINMHIGSQWFAIPRHVAEWMVFNHLPLDYAQYAQYIIIADENFFASMFRNSPYCEEAVSRSLLFVLFDKWENERNSTLTRPKDSSKCLGIDPDHCGRSPTTLTMDFKYLLGTSRSLFARKFDPLDAESLALLDYLDYMRGTHVNMSDMSSESHEEDARRISIWDSNEGGAGQVVMIKLRTEGDVHSSVGNKQGGTMNVTNSGSVSGSDLDHFNRSTSSAEGSIPSSALCMEYAPRANGLVGMTLCDAANSNQWFSIGKRVTIHLAGDISYFVQVAVRRVTRSS
jgi:hypothetical protein